MLLSLTGSVVAQPVLTLNDAVRTALKNNYDIQISSNNLEIDRHNVTLGNAGILPAASAEFNSANSIRNSRQTEAGGVVTERTGTRNSSIDYGVRLDWTIFDGWGMFARLDYWKTVEKLGEAELKQMILATTGDLVSIYYELAQQQQQLKALDTAIFISTQRLNTASVRFTIGKASKLEVLNAQVDLNTDTTSLLRQQELYYNTRVRLNEILAVEPGTPFRVEDTLAIDMNLSLQQLTDLAEKQNPVLMGALITKRISELELRQLKAARFPVIAVNTGYNFNSSRSALDYATSSNGRGLTYGLTARVNLFNGFRSNKDIKNAGIVVENSQLEIEKLKKQIRSQLESTFQTYVTNFRLTDMEEKNVEIARQNLEISLDKYNIGTITAIEFRNAQLNYVNAKLRYSNALYQAKLSEISLKEISGNLDIN